MAAAFGTSAIRVDGRRAPARRLHPGADACVTRFNTAGRCRALCPVRGYRWVDGGWPYQNAHWCGVYASNPALTSE